MKQLWQRIQRQIQAKLRPTAAPRWSAMSWVPGIAAVVAGVGLFSVGAWEPLERLVYVGLFHTRDHLQPIQWDDRVVVIAIDEQSLATYGGFPWPRDRYATLLDRLMAVQPAAIGLDILMPEATLEDQTLAAAVQYSGNVVLAVGSDPLGNPIQVTPTLLGPTDGFVRIGHVNHLPDTDGLSRQTVLYKIQGTQIVPSFGMALLSAYEQSLSNLITADPQEMPSLNSKFVANPGQYDQNHPSWVNWPGPTRAAATGESTTANGLTTLSFADVMAEEPDEQLLAQLQNKIVLVGYTAVGIVGNSEDALRTPFEKQIPTTGVYLHAAVVDNLLNDRFLTRLPLAWTLALIAVSGLGSSWLLSPLGAQGRFAVMLGIVPLWLGLAYGSFLMGVWLPVAAPIATGWIGLMSFQFIEQRERKTLMDLFAINLSPEMADFIWEHKGEMLAEGQIRPQTLTATLLFSDIRDFTSISEKLPSEVLLPWLNSYFEVMTDCIMEHGGVVDKYIGDAIMAAFGAPIARPGPEADQQNAIAAVSASLAMVEKLKDLNRDFAARGLPTIKFGIGLHTGSLVGGTVGSRHRANYSLFGDAVNVAARLQDMTKTHTSTAPYPILLSEATAQQVTDQFCLTPQGQLQLRGRSEKTTAYTLSSREPAINPAESSPTTTAHSPSR
ncbi:MAG: adenylate/guanylate cyclase domain-containing protein [Cyanobacteria bacterium J06607_6]